MFAGIGREVRFGLLETAGVDGHAVPLGGFQPVRDDLPLPVGPADVVGRIAESFDVGDETAHHERDRDLFSVDLLDVPEDRL